MDGPSNTDRPRGLDIEGPLSREEARALLDRGSELLSAGEFADAFHHYRRVIGFDDPEVTAAALLGAAQSRFRMDDEAGAVATWEAILELPETPSTYYAWREIAAARVRVTDLQGAIAAYREADKRAPLADKAEIANRLGWLAKETGNVRASRRYFARGRGSVLPLATYGILGITIAVSATAMLSTDGAVIGNALALDKVAVADGEIWRLWTVTLVHAGLIHLALNMYALYICGPLVEQIYGPIRMVLFYLVAAAGGSIASFALGTAQGGVGASGAVYGLFGVLFVASRLHLPMLDRRGRALLGQVGMIIVVNIIISFTLSFIDNFAHLGGLAAGVLIAVAFPPGGITSRFVGSPLTTVAALAVLVLGLAAGMSTGLSTWSQLN
jgi:membrane associated rhomboid family serine protease